MLFVKCMKYRNIGMYLDGLAKKEKNTVMFIISDIYHWSKFLFSQLIRSYLKL